MRRIDFNQLIAKTFESIQELSDRKGHEYSGEDDALSNFKRNATAIKLLPEQVWHVYFAKHYDSICTYIAELNQPTQRVLTEPIEGRIDDAITYLLLLKGLVKDREDYKKAGPFNLDDFNLVEKYPFSFQRLDKNSYKDLDVPEGMMGNTRPIPCDGLK